MIELRRRGRALHRQCSLHKRMKGCCTEWSNYAPTQRPHPFLCLTVHAVLSLSTTSYPSSVHKKRTNIREDNDKSFVVVGSIRHYDDVCIQLPHRDVSSTDGRGDPTRLPIINMVLLDGTSFSFFFGVVCWFVRCPSSSRESPLLTTMAHDRGSIVWCVYVLHPGQHCLSLSHTLVVISSVEIVGT